MLSLLSLFTAFVILTAYLIGILANHGVLKSISISDYWLKRPWKFMFELTMFICGISIIINGFFLLERTIWLLVVGGGGVFMVGLFPKVQKNIIIKTLHYIFAISGFTFTGLSFWLSHEYWFITLAIAIAALSAYIIPAKNKIWYIEVTLCYLLFIGLTIMASIHLQCN